MPIKLRKGFFIIDGCGKVFEGYTAGERWNGWACPRFTKEVGLKITNALGKDDCQACYNEYDDTFNFVMVPGSTDPEDVDNYGAYPAEIDGKVVPLYPIGAWCWVWVETDEKGNWLLFPY